MGGTAVAVWNGAPVAINCLNHLLGYQQFIGRVPFASRPFGGSDDEGRQLATGYELRKPGPGIAIGRCYLPADGIPKQDVAALAAVQKVEHGVALVRLFVAGWGV